MMNTTDSNSKPYMMEGFRNENRFLIYYVNICGLPMKSISLVANKWVAVSLRIWSAFPAFILLISIYVDMRALIVDDMQLLAKYAMVRKIFVTFGYFFKNIIFYYYRDKFEQLMDLWDESFNESFYAKLHQLNRRKNRMENRRTVRIVLGFAITAALCYSVPGYFSKSKKINHPSGLIYPHRSPEFEFVVTFDVYATLCCVSAVAFDCVLIVFLSQVRSKLEFLKEALTDIINELIIDNDGRLKGRRTENLQTEEGFDESSYFPEDIFYRNRTLSQISPEDLSPYEERELNSVEFQKNIKNVEEKLRVWILQHQKTILFFDEIKKVYSSVASFELGFNVIYTALTALHVVQMKLTHEALGIALVASSNLMSLYLWCKLSGDLSSIETFSGSFSRAWYLYPKKIKTAFMFIIIRSSKPLSLYGFSLYSMSLATFFGILKLTYQFFAFMVQITSK